MENLIDDECMKMLSAREYKFKKKENNNLTMYSFLCVFLVYIIIVVYVCTFNLFLY